MKLQACISYLIVLIESFLSCISQGPGSHLGEMLCYQRMCSNRARAALARPGWSSANEGTALVSSGTVRCGVVSSGWGSGCGASGRFVQECGLQLVLDRWTELRARGGGHLCELQD